MSRSPASRSFTPPPPSTDGGAGHPTVWISGGEAPDCNAVSLSMGAADGAGPAVVEAGALSERLARGLPDVLVLTGRGALDLCRRLREAHDALTLPILVLGARVTEALAVGANDAASEPWETDEVAARVEALARTRRLHAGALAQANEERRHVEARLASKRVPFESMTDADHDAFPEPTRVLPALGFLARAGEIMTGPLDSRARVAVLTQIVVPEMADFGGVYLAGEGDDVELAEAACADPADFETARSRLSLSKRDPRRPHPVVRVVKSGRSKLYAELTEARLVQLSFDADDLERLRAWGIHSWICVPLSVGDKVLGALALSRRGSRPCFNRADLVLCEELGRRAAGAIENAQLFEMVERERRSAQEANRLKDEFLANVNHELRTPLTAILGWTRMLRTRALAAERQAHALEVIERSADKQRCIVEDLLDASLMLAGQVSLDLGEVDPALAVESAVTALRPAAEDKGLSLRSTLDPAVGLVRGDAKRLQQAVHKLLSNAVKFTPSGGSVEVRLELDPPEGVVISVTDTGPGIPESFLPHVFDRFRQADGGITRLHGGLGLGLAIARHLIELHGGIIEARSEGHGRGATVVIHLPALGVRAVAPTARE